MNTPTPITLPPEFFSLAELAALAGTPQRVRLLAWLRDAHVVHVVGLHGWPLVYRTALLPVLSGSAHNTDPAFDFGAARAPRRPTPCRA